MVRTRDTCNKIRCAPLHLRHKTKLVKTVAIPRSSYVMMSQLASPVVMQSARTAIVNNVWGTLRPMRCVEIVLSVLNNPCEIDPFCCRGFSHDEECK